MVFYHHKGELCCLGSALLVGMHVCCSSSVCPKLTSQARSCCNFLPEVGSWKRGGQLAVRRPGILWHLGLHFAKMALFGRGWFTSHMWLSASCPPRGGSRAGTGKLSDIYAEDTCKPDTKCEWFVITTDPGWIRIHVLLRTDLAAP